jgi:hypothetical protein
MNVRSMLSLAAGIAILAAGAAHAQVKLRYAHVGVANAPQTLYADEVAKLIKERTNGRVEIQVFANSQLGGVGEMVDGVKSGAISMGHHDFASLGKIVPNTAVFNTPFVYRDPGHALRATDPRTSKALQEINKELVEKGNMRIVGSFFQGTRELTSKEKVLSPKDMQGKKYRGVPVKLWSSMITGMGAVAPRRRSLRARDRARDGTRGRAGEPAAQHLQPQAVRGAEVRDDDQPHAVRAVGLLQREGVAVDLACRPQDHRGHARRSGRKTLEWDAQTAAKYRADLEPRGWCSSRPRTGSTFRRSRRPCSAR